MKFCSFVKITFYSFIATLFLGISNLSAMEHIYFYPDGRPPVSVNSDTAIAFVASGEFDRWRDSWDRSSAKVPTGCDIGGDSFGIGIGGGDDGWNPSTSRVRVKNDPGLQCVLSNGIQIRQGKGKAVFYDPAGKRFLTETEVQAQEFAALWRYCIKRNFKIYAECITYTIPKSDKTLNFPLTEIITKEIDYIKGFIEKDANFEKKLISEHGVSQDTVKKLASIAEFSFLGLNDDGSLLWETRYRIYRCNVILKGSKKKGGPKNRDLLLEVEAGSDLYGAIPLSAGKLRVKQPHEAGYGYYAGFADKKVALNKQISDDSVRRLGKVSEDENALKLEYSGDKNATKDLERVSKITDILKKNAFTAFFENDEAFAQKSIAFLDSFLSFANHYIPDVSSLQDDHELAQEEYKKAWDKSGLLAYYNGDLDAFRKKSDEVKLMSPHALATIHQQAFNISREIARSSVNRELFEKVYNEQIRPRCQKLLNEVSGKPTEPIVINTIRVVSFQLLSKTDLEKSAEFGTEGMLVSVFRVIGVATEIARTAKAEFEEVQNIEKKDKIHDPIILKSFAPISTMFNETGQVLDAFLETGTTHAKQVLELSLLNPKESLEEGFGKRIKRIAKEVATELPAAPSAGDIKTQIGLINRVNQCMLDIAGNNKIVQEACNTNSKFNDMAMVFAMNNDLEDATVIANFSKEFMLGFLNRASYNITHPIEFGLNMASGVVNLSAYLISEYTKYQTLDDAFWTFDADKMDAAAATYVKDAQAQAKAFGAFMNEIKSKTPDQIAYMGGGVAADAACGCFAFKALRIGSLKAMETANELVNACKAERALAGVSGKVAITDAGLETLPGVTKVVMEEGDIVAERVAEVIKTDASLLLKEGKSPAKVAQDLVKDVKIGRGSNFANQTKLQLTKSKASHEALIVEHEKKLADYISDPVKYDEKGLLKGVSAEIKQKRIQGRIRELEAQIRRQKFNLDVIKELLKLKE